MEAEKMLTLEAFEEASETVSRVTAETKLISSDYFSSLCGNKVYLKPENMQKTGAYKLRGAYYKISTLSEEERARGLITASAGNHAQGVAYAAKAFGCRAVIVMPTTTPLIKVNRTKSYGAEVVLYGDVYDESCAYALSLAEEKGYTFIHPFDDPAVATGQGTIAMEIIKARPLHRLLKWRHRTVPCLRLLHFDRHCHGLGRCFIFCSACGGDFDFDLVGAFLQPLLDCDFAS